MRRGRFITGVSVLAAVAAVGAPSAMAASPQQIYKDYADNGRLDHTYSQGDLQRALKNAVFQGYKPQQPAGGNLGNEVKKQSSNPSSGVLGSQLPGTHRAGGTLPFTGVDLALMTAGGLALLGLGAGMRRLGRSKA
jgi:opacity protein-like surface antigen